MITLLVFLHPFCFFIRPQVEKRGVRRHGGRVHHPLPRRGPRLRAATGIRYENGRSGETTDFM